MIPGEVSSTLSASYSPLAPGLARNRTAITQFRLNSYVVKTGIYNNTLIGLLLSIIDLVEPLIHADDRRHASRRPQHADVPQTPNNSLRRRRPEFRLVALRITPPLVPVLRLRRRSGVLPVSEPYLFPRGTASPHERSGPTQIGMVAAFLQFRTATHESLPARGPQLRLQLLPRQPPPDPAAALVPDLALSGWVLRDRPRAT